MMLKLMSQLVSAGITISYTKYTKYMIPAGVADQPACISWYHVLGIVLKFCQYDDGGNSDQHDDDWW